MPNIEPIIGAAVKGARKIAGIMGAGAKDVNPTYRMGVSEAKAKAEATKLLKDRQRIDTDAIAKHSVQVKPSAETRAKLSKAMQEERLKRASEPKIFKTPVKKVVVIKRMTDNQRNALYEKYGSDFQPSKKK
jgi:hypothetical protein